MATIGVKEINQQTFHVTVSGGSTTKHEVSVGPAYAQKLSSGKIQTAELVKVLLERESNNSMLRRFDLSMISRYFPEYESTISKQYERRD